MPSMSKMCCSACSVLLVLLIYEPVFKTILINVSLKAIKLTFFSFFLLVLDPKLYEAECFSTENLLRFYGNRSHHPTSQHEYCLRFKMKNLLHAPFVLFACRREGFFSRFIDSHATHHRFPQLAYFLCVNFYSLFVPSNVPRTVRKNKFSFIVWFRFVLFFCSLSCFHCCYFFVMHKEGMKNKFQPLSLSLTLSCKMVHLIIRSCHTSSKFLSLLCHFFYFS